MALEGKYDKIEIYGRKATLGGKGYVTIEASDGMGHVWNSFSVKDAEKIVKKINKAIKKANKKESK